MHREVTYAAEAPPLNVPVQSCTAPLLCDRLCCTYTARCRGEFVDTCQCWVDDACDNTERIETEPAPGTPFPRAATFPRSAAERLAHWPATYKDKPAATQFPP